MASVGGEEAMIPDEVAARAGDECGESSDEIQWLEQDVGGAVGVGAFELIDHEPVGVEAQAFEGDGRAEEIAAYALELITLVGLTGDGGVQRETVA